MPQFTAVHFAKPQQLGKPLAFAPGLHLIAGHQGRNLRLQLVAHGPIAAAILRAIEVDTTPASRTSLDNVAQSRKVEMNNS